MMKGLIERVPMRVCTSEEMKSLDALAASEYSLESKLLMENAGRAASQVILEHHPRAGIDTEVLIFAGKGNNAGDAFVVARRFLCLDRRVRVFCLQDLSTYQGVALENLTLLKKLKAKITYLERAQELQSFFESSAGPFTVIDGILGTGLRGNVEGLFYDVIEMLNAKNFSEVISLDIPSGVCGTTGAIRGTSILSTLTLSFGFPKLGHFLPLGATRRGELINVDISLPAKFRAEGDKYLLMKSPMRALLKARDRYGHKNSFGHTLLIGGSPGRVGAISMAARACHKMGTGLVTAATWEESFSDLVSKLPLETMAVPLLVSGPEYEAYKRALSTYSSVVVGPGLGSRPEIKQLLTDLLSIYDGPVVMDADALNAVSEYRLHDFLAKRRAPVVLTPHPGEMARLLNASKDTIVQDLVASVKQAVQLTHAVTLLKGAATFIGSPQEILYLNHYPNDGMATAGSGDVLAGMIGGLIGQGMDPFQGTLLGVYLHSLAGDFAAKHQGHRSMIAQDIIENIGNAFKDLKDSSEAPPATESRVHLL